VIVLTLEQVLEIHALVIETTGGSAGLRDLGRLEAAVASQTQNVFGDELYPSVVDKAAALTRGIIADHAFVNGNKRTAMLAGITLLVLNGYSFNAQVGEIEDFGVSIAINHIDVPQISEWFADHISQ
jgi:death-on-curing protein